MLLKKWVLDGAAEGRITMAFRRWKRPTVKTGGSLKTRIGVLAIDSVDLISEKKITNKQAKQAGYSSRQEILDELKNRQGDLYRISFHFDGADPRIELRQQTKLSDKEMTELKTRLKKMDERSGPGPWTMTALTLIANQPGTRAPDLAESIGWETKPFKTNIRKLKALGLTESLKVGYRLSPRGKVVYAELKQ